MRTTLFPIIFVFIAVIISSCKQPGTEGEMNENMDSLISNKYDEIYDRDSSETRADPIKSGIIYMQSTKPIHGSDVERTIYFDDYGHKRYTETVTIIKVGEQRVTTTQVTLDVDGYTYKFDPEKKFGTKAKVNNSFNPTQIDFTRLDKVTMEDFGIKREGSEIVAGKNCVVYTIDFPTMNFKGRYAVWNNLPLHEEFSTSDFGYEYIATKLEENVEIPESRFFVPSEIEFDESTAGQVDTLSDLQLPQTFQQ